jgi:two-component system alkaline phosphatase synthesis response regulator PhoP
LKLHPLRPKIRGAAMARKPVILCVDDTSSVLEGRQMLLEKNRYKVLTAINGKEALQVFVSNPVDLVLLDYHMPEMNGDVAARRMKADKLDVPIAFLSSDELPPSRALEAADAFISKSEPIISFLEKVDYLLNLRFLFQPLNGFGADKLGGHQKQNGFR